MKRYACLVRKDNLESFEELLKSRSIYYEIETNRKQPGFVKIYVFSEADTQIVRSITSGNRI